VPSRRRGPEPGRDRLLCHTRDLGAVHGRTVFKSDGLAVQDWALMDLLARSLGGAVTAEDPENR